MCDISNSEYSSDSEIYKISSCCEESVNCDEGGNVSDNRSMQHGMKKSGAKRRHFPYAGKPDINVILEHPVTPWIFLFVF
jgi:hypothetical protein